MSRTQRRHKTGFGYIGFGNDQNVFNRKASKPFALVKGKLNNEAIKAFNITYDHHKLTALERNQIKTRIRNKHRRKNNLALIITVVIMIPIIYLAVDFLSN